MQWALAYLAGAWMVVQGADILGNQFDWPGTLLRSMTVLLAVGFLAALVLAWYHGEKGRQRATGLELLMPAGILVIAGAAVCALSRAMKWNACWWIRRSIPSAPSRASGAC